VDGERPMLEATDVLLAALGDGLDEPRALAGALHARVAGPLVSVHEPPGERVVVHQRLAQRAPDHARRGRQRLFLLGSAECSSELRLPGREHVQRAHHVAQPHNAVDGGQLQRAGRRRRGRAHVRTARPPHGKPHRHYSTSYLGADLRSLESGSTHERYKKGRGLRVQVNCIFT